MKIDLIFEGKPFMTEFGIVGYSSVVLIQSENKNILYDCGLRGCALQIKEGLKRNDLLPEDISDVVISHMHFDHVGNLPLFKNAIVHISEEEWKSVHINPDEWHCKQTRDYIKQNCHIHFVKENDQLTKEVRVMELPGHTMGLIGLKCGTDTILCSDAIKNRYEMWDDIPLMAADVNASKKTQARIKEEGRLIYTGHDTILNIAVQVSNEPISFNLKFADGNHYQVNYKK